MKDCRFLLPPAVLNGGVVPSLSQHQGDVVTLFDLFVEQIEEPRDHITSTVCHSTRSDADEG